METSGDSQDKNPSTDQMRKKRLAELLEICIPIGRGWIWWIREDLWQQSLTGYDQCSTRQAHPGVTLVNDSVFSMALTVPVLHGTSRRNGGFAVFAITAEPESPLETWFGHLRPARLKGSDFVNRPVAWDQPWYEINRTCLNAFKPRITEEEDIEMQRFLENTGIYE